MPDVPVIYLSRGRNGCHLAVRHGALAIVVDALRASATITTLFERGVAEVLVVARVEDALALAPTIPDALLVGERGCERLPGFDLGNSPLEVLASPPMEGRTAVFTSSNGAQRLTACAGAACVMVGTLSNVTALAAWTRAYAERTGRSVVIIAAGKFPDETFISPEDEATCAYLATRIGLPIAEDSRETFATWERAMILEGLEAIFRGSRHAQRLMEIGYSEDVLFCARPDTTRAIPVVAGPVLLDGRQVGVRVRLLDDARHGEA